MTEASRAGCHGDLPGSTWAAFTQFFESIFVWRLRVADRVGIEFAGFLSVVNITTKLVVPIVLIYHLDEVRFLGR